jgi:catechol 2,3-dioxygenase-like lactoylglutathione lyase family enzyme
VTGPTTGASVPRGPGHSSAGTRWPGATVSPVPTPKVISVVSATYVRDLTKSRAFYGALGFAETSAGSNELSAWSWLHHGDHSLLLVTSTPAVEIPELPLLFYFYVDDLAGATGALQAAGTEVTHVGYPPHALGGEAKTVDPDGNTVLIGQRDHTPSQPDVEESDPSQHFSLLKEAAALARVRVRPKMTCEVGDVERNSCTRPAEVKLADSWGSTAWACIQHAEEALVAAPASFIANHDAKGLGPFLASRRHR